MATEPNIITPQLETSIPPFDPVEAEQELWLAERRKGIGSSDASSLFNEGYGCIRRTIYSKRDIPVDYERTPEENRLLESGHRLEDTVAREFLEDCNAKLQGLGLPLLSIRRQPAKVSKSNPDLRANIDRQIFNVKAESLYAMFPELKNVLGDEPGPGIMEVKTTNKFLLNRAKFEGAPVDWLLQVQEQFCVVPHKWAIIVVKARDTWETLPISVLPDAEMMAEISRRATEAMDIVRNPLAELPPILDHGDKRCGNCQYRKTCRGMVGGGTEKAEEDGSVVYETDDSLSELVNLRKRIKFQTDEMLADLEQVDKEIKEKMGDREAVYVPGALAKVLYKTPKPSMSWDTKALSADHPELKDKYMKPKKASRTFRVMDAE